MNSLNHSLFTLVSEWFYRALVGVRFEKAFATDRRITINPAIPNGLDWAEATVETPYEDVRSSWEQSNEGLTLTSTCRRT